MNTTFIRVRCGRVFTFQHLIHHIQFQIRWHPFWFRHVLYILLLFGTLLQTIFLPNNFSILGRSKELTNKEFQKCKPDGSQWWLVLFLGLSGHNTDLLLQRYFSYSTAIFNQYPKLDPLFFQCFENVKTSITKTTVVQCPMIEML